MTQEQIISIIKSILVVENKISIPLAASKILEGFNKEKGKL